MSNFFESEIVKEEIKEVEILREKIVNDSLELLEGSKHLSTEEKELFFENLYAFIEKQNILFARIFLSEDDDARKVKKMYQEAIKKVGIIMKKEGDYTMNDYFNNIKNNIENLKEIL